MRITLGQVISYCRFSATGSIWVLWRRGRRRSALAALMGQERERHAEDIDVLRLEQARSPGQRHTKSAASPRPTTCSQSNWLLNARSPMMCVTVLASQPSESMPTEMTFWICSPGWPVLPTVSTIRRSNSAC